VSSLKQATTLSGWATLQNLTHREDRWILSRHHRLIERVDQLISDFQFGEAQRELYSFVWAEFADWYIEMTKVRIGEGDQQPSIVLGHVLESTLRLLHPFMPFLTEELWQRLASALPKEGSECESISIAPYPLHINSFIEPEAEQEVDTIIGIIHGARNLRAELKVEAQHILEAIVTTDSAKTTISEECEVIRKLARINVVDILPSNQEFDKSGAVSLVVGNATVFIYMPDTFDLSSERNRLEQELLSARRLSADLNTRINDNNFTSRAPIEIVERERERLETSLERQNRLRELIIQLGV
jgi:valyl-tRNA synthetase